jgi:pimeloyl-ACP methyl ester carboxylesterase
VTGRHSWLGTPQARGLVIAALVGAAACSAPVDVASERSDRIGSAGTVVTPLPTSDLDWSSCERFDIPEPDIVGTNGWECATLTAAMDPFDAGSEQTVELALTRHAATGDRRGALLLNPGGPGGTGVPFAWGIRSAFPPEVLRSFDIVSWDPRGVGFSLPAITCGESGDVDIDDDLLMEQCATASGELAAHLAAPYSASDMEAIRVALGERQLDYLGYSYGATLGAAYASLFPDNVGRFVLDGVTDPLIGSSHGYFEQGFPYYAEDGIPAAMRRFEELCDASERCPLGDDTASALDDLGGSIGELPTDDFAGNPAVVDRDVFSELIVSSLSSSDDWELLATGLGDAVGGDASAVASLVSTDQAISSEALDEPAQPFEYANIVIYCVDFRHVITDWSYCDGIPENARTLAPVVKVELDTPILVIGTDFDPLTPGKHAPDFAAALGDAVAISWSGVGHTAFPAPTECINGAVVRFLLDGVVPTDGLECPFLDEVGPEPSDEQLGEIIFGHGDAESERLLGSVFEFGIGLESAAASCAARTVNQLDDQTISHVALAVSSASADNAVADAQQSC